MKTILGLRIGHDAAAALIVDGHIVADVAEERFTRVKNDGSFPLRSIRFCLAAGGIAPDALDAIAIGSVYTPPALYAIFPGLAGARGRTDIPELPIHLETFPVRPDCRVVNVEHHLAHAASAFLTSGLTREKTLVVTMDGRGDDISTAVWRGLGNRLEKLASWDGTSSLAWFYSLCTEALDWRHGSDEWKTMGLAPYGRRRPGLLAGWHPEFAGGTLVKPRDYGFISRWPDHGVNQYHMPEAAKVREIVRQTGREDFSAEAQGVCEDQAMHLVLPWLEREKTRHLCCAGGFFLNVKFNQKLWYTGRLDTQWIYPNPGDSGLAVGAALQVWHEAHPGAGHERLRTLYFGPEYSDAEIRTLLQERKLAFTEHTDIAGETARLLAAGKIVGWFQGRMESGPRALGGRSILMSPLKPEAKDLINACVKYREAFRPFCPSLLAEVRDDYLRGARDEAFMVTSFEVHPGVEKRIPAVVHVDGTARPQLVHHDRNLRYHDLIRRFGELTGEPVLLNTSFNVKGEPIVCNPREALKCFFDTGLEVLILGSCLLKK